MGNDLYCLYDGSVWIYNRNVIFNSEDVSVSDLAGSQRILYLDHSRHAVLLQLYFFYFFLPQYLPFELSEEQCIIMALVVNASAYVAEIIRSGIQAVDAGQTEAAKSLGMSGFHTMTRVILPQAVKNILPALGNEFIVMIKEASMASVFFITEITSAFKTVQSATFITIPALMISGGLYLLLTTVSSFLVKLAERRLRAND